VFFGRTSLHVERVAFRQHVRDDDAQFATAVELADFDADVEYILSSKLDDGMRGRVALSTMKNRTFCSDVEARLRTQGNQDDPEALWSEDNISTLSIGRDDDIDATTRPAAGACERYSYSLQHEM
jgi:hypothetical protein